MPMGGHLPCRFPLRFRDDGVGMSSDVQKRIFEPFFSSSKEGGSGLGMAIVKSVVDAHEGAMMVDSSENQGTTFTVKLPLLS